MTSLEGTSRIEARATSLSWIPSHAVTGALKLTVELGIAHFDQPPADDITDIDDLLAADAVRFVNHLTGWIDVHEGQIRDYGSAGGGRLGSTTVRLASRRLTFAAVALPDITSPPEIFADRVRFTQTAGGHTGVVVPRRIPRAPFVRLTAPLAWSTITLTIRADGTSESELTNASAFPRHYLYDTDGHLTHKSAVIRYQDWLHRSEEQTSPWGGVLDPIPTTEVRETAERTLANAILAAGGFREHSLPAGELLSSRPIADTDVHVLLDGLLTIRYDGQPVVEAGPGAIFDPAMRTAESRQHVTVAAETPCRLAILTRDRLDSHSLLGVASEQRARLGRTGPAHREAS
jgi:hypothetical protein